MLESRQRYGINDEWNGKRIPGGDRFESLHELISRQSFGVRVDVEKVVDSTVITETKGENEKEERSDSTRNKEDKDGDGVQLFPWESKFAEDRAAARCTTAARSSDFLLTQTWTRPCICPVCK